MNNPTKPITGAFQLQTKIRLIIQQLLTATVRKLTSFNEKVDKFQDYFIIYKEKIQVIQKNGLSNTTALNSLSDLVINNKESLKSHIIKIEERGEKSAIENEEIKDQLKELQKKFKQMQRQNQNMTSQFSKTKSKFLDFSDLISTLKQQVSWKISKYVQQTVNINAEIKINNEAMKNQYSNITMALQKQRQKYQQIIRTHQEQTLSLKRMGQNIHKVSVNMMDSEKHFQKIEGVLSDLQINLSMKNKLLDNKFEGKIIDLEKSNDSMKRSVKKVEEFAIILDGVQEGIVKNHQAIIKKMDEGSKKTKENLDAEVLSLNKEKLKSQRKLQKKILQLQEKQQKYQDYFSNKMDFLKQQITQQISKTSAILQQKQKSEKNIASDTMTIINQRFNKIVSQNTKIVHRVQLMIKEVKTEVKIAMQDNKEQICDGIDQRIHTQVENIVKSGNLQLEVSNRNIGINPETQKLVSQLSGKVSIMNYSIKTNMEDIMKLKEKHQILQNRLSEDQKNTQHRFWTMEQALTERVEKMMFLVTKMRGDSIIRNQFTDKQIKQIKKYNIQAKKQSYAMLKVLPAMGELINIIMALIFDAQYQHSKIIQQSLPQLDKDMQRFSTLMEGVIYQFREKKKPGVIYYRHKEMKKIDIVKAGFYGYISLWEEVFEEHFKDKPNMIPKGFFKKCIEKNIGVKNPVKTNFSPDKQRQPASLQLLNTIGINQNTNQSFQIRKKKTLKPKQQLNRSTTVGGESNSLEQVSK